MHTRGRGRPKLERPDKDYGTPELQLKRSAHATEEALDAYLRRGVISTDQHWCGIHLRWLYTLRYGIPCVKAADASHPGGMECKLEDANWRKEREEEYTQAMEALKKTACHAEVLQVAVFNQPLSQALRATDHIAQLCDGLEALAELWC